VRPVTVDEAAAAAVALEPSRVGAWRERLAAAYRQLTDPEDLA
jgi:hypothetical protein